MKLHLHPLFSTLRRNPAGAILVALQIAVTLAVLVNAAALVTRSVAKMRRPTDLNTRDTFVISVGRVTKDFNVTRGSSEDLAYLRTLPEVAAATVTQGIPMTFDGFTLPLTLNTKGAGPSLPAAILPVDESGLRALGVRLVAGRNFRADEIATESSGNPFEGISDVIVTQTVARTLFPHGNALQKTVYLWNKAPLTIIGITHDFMGPQVALSPYASILIPEIVTQFGGYDLLVRTKPGARDAVLRAAKAHIGASHQNAVIIGTTTLAAARREMNLGQRNLVVFLTVISTIMLIFCCFGVFGLCTFNVGSRTKQIGIRRAVGARRRDIVTHFLAENALILAAGLLLGSVLALAIGQWLSDHEGVARLDPWYLLIGILVLGLVAQFAAWQPARRAARVPPSVATRTV